MGWAMNECKEMHAGSLENEAVSLLRKLKPALFFLRKQAHSPVSSVKHPLDLSLAHDAGQ